MPDTLSDTVAKAFDAAMPEAASSEPALQREEVRSPAPEMRYEGGPPVTGAREQTDERPTVESINKAKAQRERDEQGRFASKNPAQAEKEPAPEKIVEPAAPVQDKASAEGGSDSAPPADATLERAPANWKPAAREKWAALPAEVKAEALRVHAEVNKTMQESAEARKNYAEIKEAIGPYEQAMRASGYTPARALQEFTQLSYTVNQGTAQQLGHVIAGMAGRQQDPARAAQAIAHAISTLNVDYDLLNRYLDGMPAQGAHSAPAPVDVNAAVEQALQARIQAALQQKRQQEEQSFAQKNEFFEDVAPRMRAIRAADPSLSLDEVYRIACQMDPEISKVLQQRAEASKATELAKKAAAAKAASGVKPSPAVSVATKSANLKDTVAAAFDKYSGNR